MVSGPFPCLVERGRSFRASDGVDLEAAARLGVPVVWALSLPGKAAPVTAGRAIKTAIYNILQELGASL